jgi:hypothetical protein
MRSLLLSWVGTCLGTLLSSAYGFLAGTWPFGVVEIVWALVAVNRYRPLRADASNANPSPGSRGDQSATAA